MCCGPPATHRTDVLTLAHVVKMRLYLSEGLRVVVCSHLPNFGSLALACSCIPGENPL